MPDAQKAQSILWMSDVGPALLHKSSNPKTIFAVEPVYLHSMSGVCRRQFIEHPKNFKEFSVGCDKFSQWYHQHCKPTFTQE